VAAHPREPNSAIAALTISRRVSAA